MESPDLVDTGKDSREPSGHGYRLMRVQIMMQGDLRETGSECVAAERGPRLFAFGRDTLRAAARPRQDPEAGDPEAGVSALALQAHAHCLHLHTTHQVRRVSYLSKHIRPLTPGGLQRYLHILL